MTFDDFGIGMLISLIGYPFYALADGQWWIYVLGIPFTVIGMFIVIYKPITKRQKISLNQEKNK